MHRIPGCPYNKVQTLTKKETIICAVTGITVHADGITDVGIWDALDAARAVMMDAAGTAMTAAGTAMTAPEEMAGNGGGREPRLFSREA